LAETGAEEADGRQPSGLLPAPRERPRGRRAVDERDELTPFQLIELHLALPAQARSQDIELARISQEVTERFYNLLAVREGGRCLKWVDAVEKGF
jgi:hypothetical protein